MDLLDAGLVRRVVAAALQEDVGSGDITTESVIAEDARIQAFIVCRAPGVVAGLPVAEEVFRQVSDKLRFVHLAAEGQVAPPGHRIAEVAGPGKAILTGERVALNFLQRLSGIATLTREAVSRVRLFPVKILDTRKTTPGLRALERYAVRVGGGTNHRFGLYDQALIKDNHLRMLLKECTSLPEAVLLAVRRAREKLGVSVRIEVECESLEMVEAALKAGADIIMLDNMRVEQMAIAAGRIRAARARTQAEFPISEASGGVTVDKLSRIAETGVDTISMGALTHSALPLDLSMEFPGF